MAKDIVQLLTDELQVQGEALTATRARLAEVERHNRAHRQIIEGLFSVAEPGSVKNSLWAKYQRLEREGP